MTKASHSVSHFDLIEYVKDFVQPEVAAQMAQSVAWKIDALIQGTSRELLKFVRQDAFSKGIDGLAELTIALRESEFAAHTFGEAGSGTDGHVKTIGQLMYFREAAHNIAAELTPLTTNWQSQPNRYETPDIEDIFFATVNLKIKPVTHRRMAISVKRKAEAYELSEEEQARHLAHKIQRKQDQLKDVGLRLEDQAPAVFEMYRQACASSTFAPGETFRFYNLDLALQRQLIDHAIVAADRAQDRAEDNDRMLDSEYDDISMAVMKVNKDLKSILKSPRFVTQEQTEAAGTI